MAEIPVEKKSSMAWLWWLLLLAGIIALIWWALSGDDGEEDLVVADPVEEVDTMETTEVAAITGVAGLASLGDMIGRDVELSGVAVNEVVSDEGFTVGEGENETLVMFDEERTPDTPMEGNVDVNPGSNVTISGTVREYDASSIADSATEEVASNTQAMIFATNVDVVD
ncbi:hypothetical protein [Aurantiacibacter poecillastricola]|uniref:hypothetical protein n=1 Tax=Aurantiacibacter poecillastricola TaxID=3064385 RepID=UPI00273F98B3|nr:hypothetical protein [Aurantiacibacter sp. 219JJ12-13]MDP5260824.1 hypothetical protein [Aurantiacibacter sp. 219JJ12-13]